MTSDCFDGPMLFTTAARAFLVTRWRRATAPMAAGLLVPVVAALAVCHG